VAKRIAIVEDEAELDVAERSYYLVTVRGFGYRFEFHPQFTDS